MATVINDLVTKFSFDGSIKPLTEYNAHLGGSIKLLGGFYAALNAGAGLFSAWASGVLTGVDALSALSRESGVSVGKIQELNYIAGQTQSSAAAVEASVRGLADTIGKAAQQGSEDFARLGISVRGANGQIKSADQVLNEVGQRFRALNLSMQEQRHFAQALGIDVSLLQMMNKTGQELATMRDRARELGVLTEEQTKQAVRYKQSLNSLWFGLNSVKQLVAIGVAPELSKLAGRFTQLIADNRDWIVNGIQFTAKWIGNLLAAFDRLIPVFPIIGAGFLLMRVAALGFGGVMGIILSPVYLITAAIVLLLAVVDDLIVAFHGGNSVIAKFFKETFDVDIVDAISGAFGTLKHVALDLWDSLTSLFNGLGKILSGNFAAGLDDIWRAIVSFSRAFWTLFDPLIDAVKNLMRDFLPDWAIDLLGMKNAPIPQGPPTGPTMDTIPVSASAGSAAQTTIDNRRVEQRNTIQISTLDPTAAGRAVGDTLQRQMDNANTQLMPGGR